ncbi:hypothetical protein SY83_03575 [Paenibacillus swuensis]|uniref:ABC transporter domain-containing protein n=1 Tax=Paenibacillus swuensis TaxID=1178515 RepID=A0A172TEV5_9BACL|nr:ABC transporter ATP-binding protein [Paenibacillus swuensis]ANE45540.1 hypothetical protein SY83_03575 [Paenibacillus swuensis]
MNNSAVLTFNGVRKQLGRSMELGPLELEFERGLVYAIVGPNGSGKSTLMRMILGLMQPDEGELRVQGVNPAHQDPEQKQRVSYVPESSEYTDDSVTAANEASFIKHWYPAWDEALFRSLIAAWDIDLTRKLKKMSKGEQRRFDLAVGLARNPELLLLDEPSSGLDPLVWRQMTDRLTSFMEDGHRTIVMATHIIEEVRRLADIVIFVYKGKVLGVYEKDELFRQWKVYWVDGIVEGEIGAAVESTVEGNLTRVVTSDAGATEQELVGKGLPVMRTEALDLDDIMYYIIRNEQK